MKQFFSYLGASLAAIAALASCNKEIDAPVEDLKGGVPFEICASTADTKTAINDLATSWVADDAINLFHAVASTTDYTSDGQFTITADNLTSKKFTGELASPLEAGNYDWYAFYPYNEYITTPANASSGWVTVGGTTQTQEGNDSMAHLCGDACPLYGVAAGVASDVVPSIEMKHLTSIIEVNVINNSGEDLTVTNVTFTGSENIVGTYYINFAGTPVKYTASNEKYVSTTASLSVSNGAAIVNGSSAKFYIAVKPFTATAEQTLSISVNGYSKDILHTKDVTFTAGKIKKVNFNFNKLVVDYVTLPWTEDFSGDLGIYTLENGGGTTMTYKETNAGGTSPELLVAKNKGSFSAKVKATAGDAVLTFKSNHPDYLGISVDNDKITLSKVSNTEYNLSIPSGVEYFNLKFTNTNSSNTRLDDISLKLDDRTVLSTPMVIAYKNSEVNNSIDVVWDMVENAGSYVVTATPAEGAAVSNTVTADESETYNYTITGLAYETEYTISVVAKPSDTSLYKDSEAGVCDEKITTGVGSSTKEPIVIILDAKDLSSTATTEDSEITAGGVTFVLSKGAKKQSSTSATNAFSNNAAILIGKSGAYIYNKTAIPGVITKFEIYANAGASTKVSVGVNFSNSAISGYSSTAANTYTQTLSTANSVYDCSTQLPSDAKYFWYQVTNANNSQVQFRITYIPE